MIYEWRTYEALPGKLSAPTHLEEAGVKFTLIPLGKSTYDGNADSHD
jgi:hypothetical protein